MNNQKTRKVRLNQNLIDAMASKFNSLEGKSEIYIQKDEFIIPNSNGSSNSLSSKELYNSKDPHLYHLIVNKRK